MGRGCQHPHSLGDASAEGGDVTQPAPRSLTFQAPVVFQSLIWRAKASFHLSQMFGEKLSPL